MNNPPYVEIQAVPDIYGNKDLDTSAIGDDYLPYFKWCDANDDGSVALFESARCGSKSGFWYPSQVGWFDWATYATSISLEFAQIMMKYMDNIDRDHSMSLDQSEFAWHYAAMTHTSAEAVFDLLDENKDGKLTGKFLEKFLIFSSSDLRWGRVMTLVLVRLPDRRRRGPSQDVPSFGDLPETY